MKKVCIYCIALVVMCGSFLRCATTKTTVIETPTEVTPAITPNPYPLKMVITGIVKNETGNLLKNAMVKLNNGQTAETNNEGNFSIETEVADAGATAVMYISYSGLVTAVRSYHAAMGNAFYDVSMHPPIECCIKNECFASPVTTVFYVNGVTQIDNRLSTMLLPLVDLLKEHPLCNLQFTAYGIGKKPGAKAEERLKQIQLFFAGKGIAEKRIITVLRETEISDIVEVKVVREKE
jgi:hypothetical protein